MRIDDWSSDVCSSDLDPARARYPLREARDGKRRCKGTATEGRRTHRGFRPVRLSLTRERRGCRLLPSFCQPCYNPSGPAAMRIRKAPTRSEEHTSELQSLMRISYAVFCWKKKNIITEKDKNRYNTLNYNTYTT